jgi:hypothetical protein
MQSRSKAEHVAPTSPTFAPYEHAPYEESSCVSPQDIHADELASHSCAERVAAILAGLGYGFELIPATARPRKT